MTGWNSVGAQRVVSPPVHAHATMVPPLTPGERAVFHFFDQHLEPEWEIYLQPYLNGLKPDVVLLNPGVGIAVFEVKDWNLGSGRYTMDSERIGIPKVIARTPTGREVWQSPVEQVLNYRQEIRDLYCPRLGGQHGLAAITAGVIFTNATTAQVTKFLQPAIESHSMEVELGYCPVTGSDALAEGRIADVFPESKRSWSRVMSSDLAKDFRNWLVEPFASEEQRTIPNLTPHQRALIERRTDSGYRRIKGPAGSGKSLVLAARAARLRNEGKEVLVVTYNITLLNYLKKQALRWATSTDGITFLNFHQWAKRVCLNSDFAQAYRDLWRGGNENDELTQVLGDRLAQVVESALGGHRDEGRYDAVLVDEGQDFLLSWWNCLRRACKPGGEMMLLADATQDLYGSAKAWTDDAMEGAGFRGGPWAQLSESFRLPEPMVGLASAFAHQFLPADLRDPPQSRQAALTVYPCFIRWQNVSDDKLADACIEELTRVLKATEPENLAVTDVVFLASDNDLGRQVVGRLDEAGLAVCSTFDEDSRASRRQKFAFYLDSVRVKATTVHSFKGFESRAMVVSIRKAATTQDLAAIYVAMTRLLRHEKGSFLAVVCSDPRLAQFGQEVNALTARGGPASSRNG